MHQSVSQSVIHPLNSVLGSAGNALLPRCAISESSDSGELQLFIQSAGEHQSGRQQASYSLTQSAIAIGSTQSTKPGCGGLLSTAG